MPPSPRSSRHLRLPSGSARCDSARLRAWAALRTGPILVGLWIAGVVVAVNSTSGFGDLGQPEASQFPVVAAEEIPAGCRLLNEYAHGGYLIATRWPEVRVSQDGRNDLYGSERIERQRELLEGDSLVELEEVGIDCVLADASRPLVEALQASDRWSLVARRSGREPLRCSSLTEWRLSEARVLISVVDGPSNESHGRTVVPAGPGRVSGQANPLDAPPGPAHQLHRRYGRKS